MAQIGTTAFATGAVAAEASRAQAAEGAAAQKSVVTISSMMGRTADRGFVAYGTAKAALAHWTKMAAQDLSPTIRVNGIYVGSILTSAFSCTSSCSAKAERLRNWCTVSPPRRTLWPTVSISISA